MPASRLIYVHSKARCKNKVVRLLGSWWSSPPKTFVSLLLPPLTLGLPECPRRRHCADHVQHWRMIIILTRPLDATRPAAKVIWWKGLEVQHLIVMQRQNSTPSIYTTPKPAHQPATQQHHPRSPPFDIPNSQVSTRCNCRDGHVRLWTHQMEKISSRQDPSPLQWPAQPWVPRPCPVPSTTIPKLPIDGILPPYDTSQYGGRDGE